MNRREFLAAGTGTALGAAALTNTANASDKGVAEPLRSLFPRLDHEVYLNAASGTPLGKFAEDGLRRYEELWRLGPAASSWSDVHGMLDGVREAFARMIGAKPDEIGFVHCTKEGEQIVLDGLPKLAAGGNVVTNDMHFSGSLHNLVGLRKAGMDVRIVRAENWDVSTEAMAEAIDEKTALVSVTWVSNVNGRIEPLRELAELAHARGAYLYADIIQGAGVVPLNVRELGVDFAACSAYKWLYGPHGVGFLYVREELQGTALRDRMYPGNARHNYTPWVEKPDAESEDYLYRARTNGRRYQPGHMSYLGYSALQESLTFLDSVGIERACRHSIRLARRLAERVDPDRYPCISPHTDRSPIITFTAPDPDRLWERLKAAKVVVTLAGNRLRVSPALYNDEGDVDALAEVLNRA